MSTNMAASTNVYQCFTCNFKSHDCEVVALHRQRCTEPRPAADVATAAEAGDALARQEEASTSATQESQSPVQEVYMEPLVSSLPSPALSPSPLFNSPVASPLSSPSPTGNGRQRKRPRRAMDSPLFAAVNDQAKILEKLVDSTKEHSSVSHLLRQMWAVYLDEGRQRLGNSEELVERLLKEKEERYNEMMAAEQQHKEEMNELREMHKSELQELSRQHKEEITQIQQKCDAEVKNMQEKLLQIQEQHHQQLVNIMLHKQGH